MARLILVGLPGVGKTSVARAVGERLGCRVIDTDEVLAAMVASPVPDHLRTVGEARFRVDEVSALTASVAHGAIVSTGGGIVESEAARRIREAQLTLWLDAPDDVLVSRVDGGDRPLLVGDTRAAIAALRARRGTWYRDVARARIDAAGPLDVVVDDVLRAMMA